MGRSIHLTPRWVHQLGPNGRCCGRKPLVYKRDPHLFCFRCNRAFDQATGKQIANWAWVEVEPGKFVETRLATR